MTFVVWEAVMCLPPIYVRFQGRQLVKLSEGRSDRRFLHENKRGTAWRIRCSTTIVQRKHVGDMSFLSTLHDLQKADLLGTLFLFLGEDLRVQVLK